MSASKPREPRKVLEVAWTTYQLACVPPDAEAEQRTATRIAFFAGATAVFHALVTGVDDSTIEPTEEDEQLMADIDAELQAFAAALATDVRTGSSPPPDAN
jgi:hypothetical protein